MQLQDNLEDYRRLIEDSVKSGSYNHFSRLYTEGYHICEIILCYIAVENGYDIHFETATGRHRSIYEAFCSLGILIPKECLKFLAFMRGIRNAIHPKYCDSRNPEISDWNPAETSQEFAKAIDYFTHWFKEEYIARLEVDSSFKYKLMGGFFSLEDILNSPKVTKQIDSVSNLGQENLLELLAQQTELLENLLTRTNAIDARTQNIETAVSEIQKNISSICAKISDYQSLLKKQVELAETDFEKDRLLNAYTEECTSRIVNSIKISNEEQSFELEKRKLIASLGEIAWAKLDEASKSFLISAKVMFNNLILLDDSLDYSGVCLLVTKALEVEMNNRFCKQYLEYLYECHRDNYSEYPTPLLGPKGTPLPLDKFTMGSYAFILCLSKKWEDTEMQLRTNKKCLLEYTSKCIFKDMSSKDIENKLMLFANKIEEIRLRFRNPAAHTNMIRRCDAEKCFSIVLDVEKLLKKMLDSFVA